MNRQGATLLEVVAAVVLLGFGALALAGSIVHALRAREIAVATALAAVAAEAWIERWRAEREPAAAGAGSAELAWGERRGRLDWLLTDIGSCLQEAWVQAHALGAREVRVVVATRRYRQEAAGC